MRTVVERLSASGAPSFLAVLKRFGAANPAPLSFPRAGWTLALDLPGASHGLGDLLHSLDRVVLDAGGRHYFAKDAHMTPDAVRRGLPAPRRVEGDPRRGRSAGRLAERSRSTARPALTQVLVSTVFRQHWSHMENALGQPQTIVLLGGTSDIGLAIVRRLLSPTTTAVVLACRDLERGERAAAGLRHRLARRRRRPLRCDRATDDARRRSPARCREKYGDIDVAIVAFGLLGDGSVTSVDPAQPRSRSPTSTSPVSSRAPSRSPTRCDSRVTARS